MQSLPSLLVLFSFLFANDYHCGSPSSWMCTWTGVCSIFWDKTTVCATVLGVICVCGVNVGIKLIGLKLESSMKRVACDLSSIFYRSMALILLCGFRDIFLVGPYMPLLKNTQEFTLDKVDEM